MLIINFCIKEIRVYFVKCYFKASLKCYFKANLVA